jgi:hypothetical protein
MTSEFGCISDPVNFVDAEVVKYDGTIVMASTEPDLLWALRGSGGGFGGTWESPEPFMPKQTKSPS